MKIGLLNSTQVTIKENKNQTKLTKSTIKI